jgi:DNA-binding LacI/PurR family transcriptional regulator
MGRAAVKLVLEQIKSDVFEQKEIKLPVQLVLRESTEVNHKNKKKNITTNLH